MNYSSKKKGIAFFTTLILIGITVLISAGVFTMVMRNIYSTKRNVYATQAYFLAEAGAEEAIAELHDDFDFTPTGYPKILGQGTYDINITTNGGDPDIKLIRATGVVNNISKIIRVQVRDNAVEAFEYTVLGGDRLYIYGNSTISNAGPIRVHSNSPEAAPKSLNVGESADSTGTVIGNATACGVVNVHAASTVTGTVINSSPSVPLPEFDDEFFQFYFNLANADGNTFTGNTEFTSDPCAGTANGVVYVTGQVQLEGTWSMTGCVVATGKIKINKDDEGTIIHTQWGNLPAFMSKNNDVELYGTTVVEGMIYANSRVDILGPTVVNGTVYGKTRININALTEVHYVQPDPPGLPGSGEDFEILSWSGG